jgi:hypothetical protein
VVEDDDDEMFRGDAPGAVVAQRAAKPAPKQEAPAPKQMSRTASPAASEGGVRVLKPFKSRAEVVERLSSADAMLSGMFQCAKWYTDESGRFVLKFDSKGSIDNIRFFKGEQLFLNIASSVTARQYSKDDLILECASERASDSVIDKILEADEIDEDAVAYLMNALYFKAKWAGDKHSPMFREEGTKKENFTLCDGTKVKVDMMRNSRHHQYAIMDGYKVLVLPYAGGKFNMYILLPDENDIYGLVEKLQTTSWNDILANLKQGADVNVRLPKFSFENKSELSETLMNLGVEKPFQEGEAEFDMMFEPKPYYYWISKVIQKSRINVSEWGTEAASVTIVEMPGATEALPQETVNFYADHPFVFIIGEETSGTILFEGIVTNP